MSEEEPDNKPVWTNWDGSQKKFYNAGGCYEMLLCFLLARGCPGDMEHTAASQVRHSWLHLSVRVVVQVYFFSFQSLLRLLGGPPTVTGDAVHIEDRPREAYYEYFCR